MHPRPPEKLRWWTSPRTILRHLLMLDDTPHSIALGTAIGMFIGITPTGGIQMALVVLTALLTRPFFYFNRIAALVMVYVSNPVTAVPLYWFCYKVGTYFIPGDLTRERLAGLLEYDSFREWCQKFWSLIVDVGGPLIVGSLVVAAISGILTYPVMRLLLRVFHEPTKRLQTLEREPAVSVRE